MIVFYFVLLLVAIIVFISFYFILYKKNSRRASIDIDMNEIANFAVYLCSTLKISVQNAMYSFQMLKSTRALRLMMNRVATSRMLVKRNSIPV